VRAANLSAEALLLREKGQPNGFGTLDADGLQRASEIRLDAVRPPTVRQISGFAGGTTLVKLQNALDWLRAQETTGLGGSDINVAAAFIDARGLGVILVTESLNPQNLNAFGWGVLGAGTVFHGKAAGKSLFEMLGSRWGAFYDLTIYGDDTNIPAIGIQVGRLTQAGPQTDTRGTVARRQASSSGMAFTTSRRRLAGIIPARSTTIMTWAALQLSRSTAITTMARSPTSRRQAWPQTRTCRVSSIGSRAVSTVIGGSGPAIRLVRADQVEFKKSYGVSFDDAIIRYLDVTGGPRDLWFDIHGEPAGLVNHTVFDRLTAGDTFVHGFFLNEEHAFASNSIIKAEANVTTLRLEGADINICGAGVTPTNGIFNGANVVVTGQVRTPNVKPGTVVLNGTLITTTLASTDLTGVNGAHTVFEQSNAQALMRGAHKVYLADDGATVGPDFHNLRHSASPATNDLLGRYLFSGRNSAAEETIYAYIRGQISSATDGGEAGILALIVKAAGSDVAVLTATPSILSANRPVQLPTYTTSTLPTAANTARGLIYVSNGADSKRVAWCDGTNWRWLVDDTVVS
jgi:hypothetical protein